MNSVITLPKMKVINKKAYDVVEYVELDNKTIIPVLNIPMMTDEYWNELVKKQQTKN